MPALNYQARFAHLVESGEKRSTIRRQRKYPIRISQKLYHYTGLRTRASRLLRTDICSMERDISIKPNGTIKIDGVALARANAEQIARNDGFDGFEDFLSFFCQDNMEFRGQLIEW